MSVESEILRIQHNIASAYTKVAGKDGEVPSQPNSANLAAAIASIPSVSELIVGDGLSKEGDTLSVTTPVQGIVTQAEFDALPEAQQSKGLYVISDGGDGGDGGASAGEVYSTEETRIGTWIDGKPIYRKVSSISLKNNTSDQHFDIGLTAVDTVTNLRIIIKRSTTANGWVVSNYMTGGGTITCGIRLDYLLWVSVVTFSDIAGQPAYAIVEYTKTTDEGGTA